MDIRNSSKGMVRAASLLDGRGEAVMQACPKDCLDYRIHGLNEGEFCHVTHGTSRKCPKIWAGVGSVAPSAGIRK